MRVWQSGGKYVLSAWGFGCTHGLVGGISNEEVPEQTVENMFLQLSLSAFFPFLPSSQRSLFRNLDIPKEQQGPPAAAMQLSRLLLTPFTFFLLCQRSALTLVPLLSPPPQLPWFRGFLGGPFHPLVDHKWMDLLVCSADALWFSSGWPFSCK